jgi:hypothetical protein
VDTAVDAGSFKTLVNAVKAAGLVDTLSGKGPFTVFAPDDAAFAKIPARQMQDLLRDRKQLRSVLTYHVVNGRISASDVSKLHSARTVQGQDVSIDSSRGVMVGDARVIQGHPVLKRRHSRYRQSSDAQSITPTKLVPYSFLVHHFSLFINAIKIDTPFNTQTQRRYSETLCEKYHIQCRLSTLTTPVFQFGTKKK